jgi:glycosyltransferase involved in cell wall biosynthesis
MLLQPRSPARPVLFPGAGRADAATAPFDIRHVIAQPYVSHPSVANGLHNVARRLVLEQLAAGDRACLYLLSAAPSAAGGVPGDVPCLYLSPGGLSLLGRPLSLRLAVRQLLEGAGPRTIVHLHGAVKPVFALLARQLRRAGAAYGVTLHGQYSHIFDFNGRPRRRLAAAYLRMIDRPALSQARFVQAITLQEAGIIHAVAPAAQVRLLPNAAYSAREEGTPRPVQRPAPGEAPLTFGFCARYEIEHKGVDLLVDGFAAYRRAGGTGVMELIGTGPARDAIAMRIAAAGLGSRIRLHGPRFGAEKDAIMAKWHYCVLASRFDVMPTGCLEAALSGLPLIVTRETGLAALAEQHRGGLSIPALSPEAVAATLARAERLGPQDWREMTAGAHRMALAIGDWGEIAARLRTFYAGP